MFHGYKNLLNAQGLKSLLKCPTMPAKNLAIGDDDEKADVPLLIFRDQGQMAKRAITQNYNELPYEETAVKGANDTLSMDNFVTDDFDIGSPYDGI
mgnify:CR=1 FL=1